jgi:hypothetical protein
VALRRLFQWLPNLQEPVEPADAAAFAYNQAICLALLRSTLVALLVTLLANAARATHPRDSMAFATHRFVMRTADR